MSAITDWAIAGSVRHWAHLKPGDPCLSCEGTVRTWADTSRRCAQIAQGLLQAGLAAQDRVMYIGKNSAEFFEIVVGASMAGVVSAAVNWRLLPHEVLAIVNQTEAKILFVEAEFAHYLADIEDQLTSIERTIVIGVGAGAGNYERWMAAQPAVDPHVLMTADDIAIQMYTSGTTGLPKGVMFSNAAVRSYDAMVKELGIGSESVMMVSMPVFHAAGASLGILALTEGASTVIAREVVPARLLDLIEEHRVTTTTLVPVVLKMLLESLAVRDSDLSSLDTIAYAASPISPELLRACLATFDCKFLQIYGMTETNSATVLRPEDHLDPEHPERMLSVGRALPGVSVRVVDPATGIDVPDGEFGEVWIKAPTNMAGYWRAPEATAATLTTDGYVRSGDGALMTDGYLYLRDRIKDMVVTGGENVYPTEIEHVLLEHPGINDVAVIGVPSDKWGETVKAVVVRAPNSGDLSAADVIEYARTKLARFKCPTTVEFLEQLPRNPSGKILKRSLRETFVK